jgi:hypothetical protein
MYCYVFLSISDTIYVLDKYDSYMFWQNIMGFQNSVPPEHSVVISHASNPPYRYLNKTKYNQTNQNLYLKVVPFHKISSFHFVVFWNILDGMAYIKYVIDG